MTTKELENYEPKGELKGFPKEIIAKMLDCQEEQSNKRDVSVFEKNREANMYNDGFDWNLSKEGQYFWLEVINHKNFDVFFDKYPKQDNQDNSQKFNLENYEPKGDLTGFPKEIIARMLEYQEEQGNKRDISVFEKDIRASICYNGFDWDKTEEEVDFWGEVILEKNFSLFFEKYPKQDNQDNSQEFRVGDKVYDYIIDQIGIIKKINKYKDDTMDIIVDFGDDDGDVDGYQIDSRIKRPYFLHYRDDYDYDVIDFNNLPKRQEPKRWRAEEDKKYYFVNFRAEGWFFSDESRDDYDYSFDNYNYNSGNYFRTEVEAEIIAQKLNSYFKQLIKEEHDTHRN